MPRTKSFRFILEMTKEGNKGGKKAWDREAARFLGFLYIDKVNR